MNKLALYSRKAKLNYVLIVVLLLMPYITIGQTGDSTINNELVAGDESDVETPKRDLVKFNHYEGKIFSIRVGGGFLQDWAAFQQDEQSKEQFDLGPNTKLRDLRFVFKGRFGPKKTNHPVTYSCGIMYDAPAVTWRFRETGIMIGIPEIWGHIFIGRTKEGFSLNKVMVGYAGWTLERSAMSDATVPILGDGIKWLGFLPKQRILWNAGFFFDQFNEQESFSTYDNQGVLRLAWLPILSEPEKTVFHTGINLRYGHVDGDTLVQRSRPEVWTAPFFVDTRKFRATNTFMYGYEIYYRRGPWLFGSEYWFEDVLSPPEGNPRFQGGDIVATWVITGETREYKTAGGFFTGISPDRPIFKGGWGAVDAVLRFSYVDLEDAGVQGGRFWRITPMMNWYLNDNLRLEFAYGYGKLYRFGLIGGTQFFQSRIQLQL